MQIFRIMSQLLRSPARPINNRSRMFAFSVLTGIALATAAAAAPLRSFDTVILHKVVIAGVNTVA